MSASESNPAHRMLAVRNLAIDMVAAEVAGAFAGAGIESLVLKGPVLAHWLYPGGIRPYGDADLMVAPADWESARRVLEGLGFADYLGPMAHPRMESFASTAFLRGHDNLDLHCTLHGLDADPRLVWEGFGAGAGTLAIGGAELRVPRQAALALHVALHAAHHAKGKALEDLDRAVDRGGDELWDEALVLARELDGEPTFASGLRLVPAGTELAERLGVATSVRSVRHEIRFEEIPMAEGIDALLAPGISNGHRLRMIFEEFFPRPDFMRWWSPLARRGWLGLMLSYPWRWATLIRRAPAGLLAVLRTRRR